jgi:hypothetical protein
VSMHPALIVLVYALAVARVTRLIVADRITQAPRARVETALWNRYWHKLGLQPGEISRGSVDPPLSVYLLGCPWCASIYVSAVAAPLAYFWGTSPWLFVPALALAFSYFTGYAAGKE